MLCRSAFRRLAAQAPKRPSTDVTALAGRLHHLTLSNISIRVSVYSRSFATGDRPAGRPKKGGAVTAKASTRRAPSKETTATKTTKTTKKKTATTKPKKAAKKKAKAAPKKVKKILTPEQKEKADQKKHAAEVKGLKAAALLGKEPKVKPANAWTVFNSENLPKGSGVEAVRVAMKENGQKFRNLTPAEREHFNHIANEGKAENEAAYKSWVVSHSPEDIMKANAARKRLKALAIKDPKAKAKKNTNAFSPIKDERQVKRPRNGYTLFFTERQKSGDFKAISVNESAKLAGSEWKALSQAEKKNYEDLYKEDVARYRRQFKDVYGFEAAFNVAPAAAATVNA